MRYGQIRKYDTANGPGIRTTIFVTGCTHNCPECFNKEYMNFSYGEIWTDEETKKICEYLRADEIAGLTVLGGEPFQNTAGLLEIMPAIKKVADEEGKNLWVYSGYTYEELMKDAEKKRLLAYFDVLVDGKFEKDKKNLKLSFRGSENQRIIDLAKTREGEVVIIPDSRFKKD